MIFEFLCLKMVITVFWFSEFSPFSSDLHARIVSFVYQHNISRQHLSSPPSQLPAHSQASAEPAAAVDSDDEEAVDRDTRKKRDWDNWKDDNPKGVGSTLNRPR
jgi:hypothetical protein